MKFNIIKGSNLTNVAKNTGWLLIDNIIRLGLGLLVGIWVARYLGPKQYGTYSFVLAYVAIFSSLATLGIDGIIVRDLVRNPEAKDDILGSVFFMKAAGGFIAVVLSGLSILFIRPGDAVTHWFVFIMAVGTIFQSFDALSFWFQSQRKIQYAVIPKIIAFLAIVAAKIILIRLKAPLLAFAWTGLAEIVLGSIGLTIAYSNQGHSIRRWNIMMARIGALLKASWPLILSGVAVFVQAKIDQVMLGSMIGDTELGKYSVAVRIVEVFGFIPMVIQTAIAPSITGAKIIGEELYRRRMLNLYRLMSILFGVIAVPLAIFSTKIVVLLFGNEYKTAGPMLALLSMRLIFTNFGVAKNLFIINENLFRYVLVASIAGAGMNVVLNIILIPKMASYGAILSAVISFLFTTFVIDLFFSELRSNLVMMLHAMITPWKLQSK